MRVVTEISRLISHFRHQGFRQGLLASYDKLVRWLTGASSMKFCKISEDVWIGGQPSENGIRALADHGITAVINMRSEYDYAEEAVCHNLEYLRLPTVDNGAPAIVDLQAGVEFIRRELGRGGRVYINCWEGTGRSATMAAAYFVSLGSSADEAWSRIRKTKPFIRPTKTQMARLEEYSKAR